MTLIEFETKPARRNPVFLFSPFFAVVTACRLQFLFSFPTAQRSRSSHSMFNGFSFFFFGNIAAEPIYHFHLAESTWRDGD